MDIADNGLAAIMDVDMLYRHFLLPPCSHILQASHKPLTHPHQFNTQVDQFFGCHNAPIPA